MTESIQTKLKNLLERFKSEDFRLRVIVILSIISFLLGITILSNILLMLLGLIWLLNPKTYPRLKEQLKRLNFWLLSIPFILTILGVLYSSDIDTAFKYSELRLTILIIPMIISTSSLSKNTTTALFITIIYSCILIIFIGLILALLKYLDTADSGYFYNDNLVSFVNNQAVYFAIYLNICLVLIYWVQKNRLTTLKSTTWIILTGFLELGIFLLASRLSILISLFLISLIISSFYFKRFTLIGVFKLSTIIIVSAIIFNLVFPKTIGRFESIFSNTRYEFTNPNDINHFNGEISTDNWNGLTLRLALWDCGFGLINENPILGVGTGDYKSEFKRVLENKEFTYAIKQGFGVHNQYLYTAISFGLVGLAIFLFSYFSLAKRAYDRSNILFLLILSVFLLGFLTENLLNRYNGVYFYSLMMSLSFFKAKI